MEDRVYEKSNKKKCDHQIISVSLQRFLDNKIEFNIYTKAVNTAKQYVRTEAPPQNGTPGHGSGVD